MTQDQDGHDTPLEAPEADVAEQRTPANPTDTDGDDAVPPVATSVVEADEADLLEQARTVPSDDDDV
jgi:hypothetical protein